MKKFAYSILSFLGLAVATQAMALPKIEADVDSIPDSTVTTYAGYYSADNGYKDRVVVGSFANIYQGRLGLHADVAYVDREQNAAFLSAGASYAVSNDVRVKVMGGTSTDNRSIMPDVFAAGSVEIKAAKGLIVTPSVTYRHFRTKRDQTSYGLAVAKYLNMPGDNSGYWVIQADGSVSDTSGRTGWTASAGIQTVRNSGWRFGIGGRAGYMAYDTLTGLDVTSHIYGGSANVGYKIKNGPEVFVRGEATHNRYFTVSGGMLGLNFKI